MSSKKPQSIIGKQSSNIVPMTLKMFTSLKQHDYPNYFGHKVDLVCLVAQVQNVQPTISKRGLFQLSFTLQDLFGGQTIIANYTQYEGQDIQKSIFERNQITSLKQLKLVKCILAAQKDKNIYYDVKHIELVSDHNYIMYHVASCINYHCQVMYNT
ncbi:unnamed protein product [Paramecium pentaurelia]|uniref:Uncharacterized protein n=1 Tax=Paramecium pentaurelia TaxID=43138 RepID=A0A8S1XVU2_9CILI|nr:unnamed protein product [Paramecium pentaurelia]